jgi:hypothetical protein
VELVLSASAFEWFDKALFEEQARRVLLAPCRVVIVWSWLEPLDAATRDWYRLASALAESALLAVTYTMWDLQYSLGEDSDRGGIIGIFSAATSIGFALSPALASVFFFKGLGASVISGVLVLVVAAASAATSLRRASANRVAARVD